MKKNIPKITDGELNVMEVIWGKHPISASEIVAVLKKSINWNRNTTYTFIKRLVDKKVISREDPGFICNPLYTKDEIRVSEARSFLDKLYGGSLKVLVTSFINNDALSEKEINDLKKLIDDNAQQK